MKLKAMLSNVSNMSTQSIRGYLSGLLVRWLIYITIVVLLFGLIFKTISYASARYACHTQWVESGIEYKYTLRGGCLLKLDKGWLPAKNYRVN